MRNKLTFFQGKTKGFVVISNQLVIIRVYKANQLVITIKGFVVISNQLVIIRALRGRYVCSI